MTPVLAARYVGCMACIIAGWISAHPDMNISLAVVIAVAGCVLVAI